jgi:hypothetical protein
MVTASHADVNAAYWADYSSVGGNYPTIVPATQCGASACGVITTNGTVDNNVVNYFRTTTDLAGAAYNGVLLGNLSGDTGLTATFSLSDSALANGAAFPTGDIVGETYPDEVGSNAGLRLMFMGGFLGDGTPNEWWSNPAAAVVTSMNNGEDVTLTVAFDPSLWSNYYGQVGNSGADQEAQFAAALSGVTRLGISFGSGYFFSDGFAFNTGGNSTAQIELDDISTIPAPEPGIVTLLVTMLAGLAGGAVVLKRIRA